MINHFCAVPHSHDISGLQGILEEGQQVYGCLKVEFLDESTDSSSEDMQQRLEKLWSTGVLVIN